MPNRILKDSICTSDSIASLSDFHEAFFYRLIVNCDDFGRMDARPAILKARLYPLRERLTLKEIQSALRALADVGCVEVYEVDGKPYLRLPSWEVHQQIRAKKSKYPAPDSACNQMISIDSKCPRNPIQSESESESKTTARASAPPGQSSSGPGSAVSFFLDRVNPTAAPSTLELLSDFERDLGPEVCIRAMMEALDAGKPDWRYIQGILRNKRRDGIRSLAAWDAHEARRQKSNERKENQSGTDMPEEFRVGEWV